MAAGLLVKNRFVLDALIGSGHLCDVYKVLLDGVGLLARCPGLILRTSYLVGRPRLERGTN